MDQPSIPKGSKRPDMEPLDPLLRAEAEARRARPPYRGQPVAEVRRSFREMQTRGERGPELEAVEDGTLPTAGGTLPVRTYRPAGSKDTPLIVYFHGGGHVIGDVDTHDRSARGLAAATGAIVMSVDYRLAPEHPFPAAIDDAVNATRAAPEAARRLGADADRILVAGDSAGAAIALATGLILRDDERLRLSGIIALYPIVDQATIGETGSYAAYGDGSYGLSLDDIDWFRELYIPNAADRRDWRSSPGLAADLNGLPPMVLIAAAYDPLRDEAATFAARLAEAGVAVTFRVVAGVNHGFMGSTPPPRAAAETLGFIRAWMVHTVR